MAELRVAVSTFPFLYSHDGLGAMRHLHARLREKSGED